MPQIFLPLVAPLTLCVGFHMPWWCAAAIAAAWVADLTMDTLNARKEQDAS